MLEFSDAPYQFFSAKPKRLVQWALRQVNRHLFLSGPNHRIEGLEISGTKNLQDLLDKGARILIVANHPTHSDVQVMTELHRRFGVKSCFMAAYDVFLRGKICAWLMQGNGAFSIDREGSDKQSMKEAIRIMREGEYLMTIFPEGNVYLNNDRVTPFMEGAAFVALKAQKELGSGQPIYAVPMSFKMSYSEDVRAEVKGQMDQVAAMAGVKAEGCANPLDELREIGRALLVQRMGECQHMVDESELGGADWRTQFESCSQQVVAALEEKMDLEEKPKLDLSARIRRIRAAIHHIRIRENEVDVERAGGLDQMRDWADEAILAFRALSYATPYVAEEPSLDRFAETTQKMREDYTGRSAKPLGKRRAMVHIGAAVNLAQVLEKHEGKLRAAVSELTLDLEVAVQQGVDHLNEKNEHVGSALF